MVSVAIVKEVLEGENRVSVTPSLVDSLKKLGLQVQVEKGAGVSAAFSDAEYKKAGASIVSKLAADIALSINPPTEKQLSQAKAHTIWISTFHPLINKKIIAKAKAKKVTLYSLAMIPRISRAQSMDVLTSQSTIVGYKSVLMAANMLPKFFPLMMSAAGTINPAKVLVLGAGVAGLQAIATAKRLGAQVEATDIRTDAKEQIESLGANFIGLEVPKAQDKNGYAKPITKEFLKRQQAEVAKHLKVADVVITTALIQGIKAPLLIPKSVVKQMKSGSIIIDTAAVGGGNCEYTKKDKTVEAEGVTVVGHTNIASLVPTHASQMYAKNICTFVKGMIKDKKIDVPQDEIYEATLVKA